MRFILLAVFMLGNIGLQVINPQLMRYFIDTALAGGALNQLTFAAIGFIVIALVQQMVSVSVTYLGENVAWTATNALRSELAWHCLNLDMGFHNEHTPGELIERIDGDVTALANFFSKFLALVVGNGLLLVGILAALFLEDWRAGLAFSVFAALALFALNRVRDIGMVHQKAFRQACADLYGYIEEQLSATEDVRSSGAVEFSLREMHRLQGEIMRHDYKSGWKNWIITNVTGLMLFFGTIVAISSGYLLYSAGAVTIGTVYLFVHYVSLLDQPIWALTHQIQDFQTIGACVERLSELRAIQPKVKEAPPDLAATMPMAAQYIGSLNGSQPAPRPVALSFENVSFSYTDTGAVLKDITFALRPGRVLGLLGRTGSGKTTLTRLIFRLYDPSGGKICFNGQDARLVTLQGLRRKIGIVTQEVQIFRASVRDNLTYFDRSIPDEQIQQVLEDLELGEWLRAQPEGLDTELDSGGHSLSAGEAQLLAFARIFLSNPGLVILDEASSRLDPLTERRIERAIERLLAGRTGIIVAHRLATVHHADEIMILEDGQISEHGARERLAQDTESRFHQLLQTGMEEMLA